MNNKQDEIIKELLSEVKQLKEENKKYKSQKKYGLVWEDEKNKEQVVEDCKNKLPILQRVKDKEIITDKSKPMNIMIEGDNYHALSCLNYTHREQVDVIYIDPPYNTGAKDWKYNNDYVDREDSYKHSKWINFMKNRIRLAYNVLSDDGFLVCAIDEYEIHNIRHVLDEVFKEENKLGMVTILHNPKGRNLSKFFSANSEFMLVYAKNSHNVTFNKVVIDEEVKKTFNLSDDLGNYRLESFLRARTSWHREKRPQNWYPIYVSKDLQIITLEKKEGYYEIYPRTNTGEFSWKNISETFNKLNKNYFVALKEENKINIYHKYREQQVFKNVWTDKKYQSEFNGTNVLKKILGGNIFDYPKSIYLLEDILKIISRKNSTILDFFGGSGTTAHAVMNLNKDDDGNRKFIICTNNEGEIAEDVCYPRIRNVMMGYKKNGNGEYVEGLGGNLHYFKADETSFISVDNLKKVNDAKKLELTLSAGELIAIKENIFDEKEHSANWQIFEDDKRQVAIYFTETQRELGNLLSKLDDNKQAIVYVFNWGKNTITGDDFGYPNVIIKDIPQPIINVYKEINKG